MSAWQQQAGQLLTLAPDWARWLAQDGSGVWWAYEAEPNEGDQGWYENEVGRIREISRGTPNPDWREALIRLPRGST